MDRAVESIRNIPAEAGEVGRLGADCGRFSERNVALLEAAGIDAYLAAGRLEHRQRLDDFISVSEPAPPAPDATVREGMMHKLRTEAGKAFYAFRKSVVEPAFGIIKEAMGFRGFSFRGLKKVEQEWFLVMLCYNLKRMFTLAKQHE
jgi:hypothetical protein